MRNLNINYDLYEALINADKKLDVTREVVVNFGSMVAGAGVSFALLHNIYPLTPLELAMCAASFTVVCGLITKNSIDKKEIQYLRDRHVAGDRLVRISSELQDEGIDINAQKIKEAKIGHYTYECTYDPVTKTMYELNVNDFAMLDDHGNALVLRQETRNPRFKRERKRTELFKLDVTDGEEYFAPASYAKSHIVVR